MARPEFLYVFCYDISAHKLRARVFGRLDEMLVRVQDSVFEGRLTRAAAERLAEEVGDFLEDGDSLRVYAVTKAGLRGSIAKGAAPMVEPEGYWLF